MCQKYIQQINKQQPFPFQTAKFKTIQSLIRVTYQTPDFKTYEQLRNNISLILGIESVYVIPIYAIKEVRGKKFTLDYQQVTQPLSGTQKFNETSFIAQTKCKIYQLFQQFAEKGIRYFPSIDEIGLDAKGQPKVYLRLDFQVEQPRNRSNLLAQYQMWNQKLFQSIKNLKKSKLSISSKASISQYSQNFDKILTQIQSKIQKKRKSKTRRWSQSKQDKNYGSSSSLISQIHLKKVRNNSFSQANRSNSIQPNIQKREEFFCQALNRQQSNEKLSQSTKEGSLSYRISEALSKTKKFVKNYEKRKHIKY